MAKFPVLIENSVWKALMNCGRIRHMNQSWNFIIRDMPSMSCITETNVSPSSELFSKVCRVTDHSFKTQKTNRRALILVCLMPIVSNEIVFYHTGINVKENQILPTSAFNSFSFLNPTNKKKDKSTLSILILFCLVLLRITIYSKTKKIIKSCSEESTFNYIKNNSTHGLSEFIGSIAFISISLSTSDFGNLRK